MSVRTIRFNKQEENMLRVVLTHYHVDFSHCVKNLFAEKLEDLRDIGYIRHLKEGSGPADYFSAVEIENMMQSDVK